MKMTTQKTSRELGHMWTYVGLYVLALAGSLLLLPLSCAKKKAIEIDINKHPEKISLFLANGWTFKTNATTHYISIDKQGDGTPANWRR